MLLIFLWLINWNIPHQFEIKQSDLKLLIEKTAFAMAQQDVRYYLNGMLLELNQNGLRFVATDGHRLALSELSLDTGVQTDKQLIIPRKGVTELGRLLSSNDSPVLIKLSQNHFRIEGEHFIFTSKLIDGNFPDYNRVIPIDGNKELAINRDTLKQALQRISILSNEKYRGVRLTLNDDLLMIQANNPDQEEAQEELTISYNDEVIEIGFNVGYLIDVLSVIDTDDVLIKLKDSNSSCVITAS